MEAAVTLGFPLPAETASHCLQGHPERACLGNSQDPEMTPSLQILRSSSFLQAYMQNKDFVFVGAVNYMVFKNLICMKVKNKVSLTEQ